MNRFIILLACCTLFLGACQNQASSDAAQKQDNTYDQSEEQNNASGYENARAEGSSIENINAEAFSKIVDPTAVVEQIGEGFSWSEGPVWVPELEALLFSDIPPNRIMQWKEGEGVSLYLTPAGYTGEKGRGGEPGSNGLLLDKDGALVLCQHGDRRMAKMDAPLSKPAPKFITLADTYDGKRFNSPNDACYDSKGNLYFTDPPYGLEKNINDPAKELAWQGVYRLRPDGDLELLIEGLSFPNGVALSPDEKTLYVAVSDPKQAIWMAYDISETLDISNARVFYDATALVGKEGEKGLPDGLKVRSDGIIFATGPGGVFVFSPEGEVLGKIRTGQATANCAFGPNEDVLFMTADDYLMRVALKPM